MFEGDRYSLLTGSTILRNTLYSRLSLIRHFQRDQEKKGKIGLQEREAFSQK